MHKLLVLAIAVLGLAALPAAAQAAPPANDDFANATVISSLPFVGSVDMSEATTESLEPQNCYLTPQTVWYSITATDAATLRADPGGSDFSDTVINVYRADGVGIGGLTFLTCAVFGAPTFDVEAGKTYYVQVGRLYGGPGTLHFNLQALAPPVNDDFGSAMPITSVPFSDTVDTSAAGVQPGEPTPSCGFGQSIGTVWYAFTPSVTGSYSARVPFSGFWSQVAAYAGNGLGSLKEIGCRAYDTPLTFHAEAGTTYYLQAGGLPGSKGALQFTLDVAPLPVASYYFYPGDPSSFDTLQFVDQSYDPGQAGISSESWSFGDGTTALNPGCCPAHRFSTDGDYSVKLTVSTTDGRTASIMQVVHVKTHDVAIAKMGVPQSASAGQTRTISVSLADNRYSETVQMELFKSVPGGFQSVGTLTQSVPLRGGNRTTDFKFSYTFTGDDAALGKVTFQAVATIVGGRDALPADNTAIALPTKVGK